jgi:hypothetical protein
MTVDLFDPIDSHAVEQIDHASANPGAQIAVTESDRSDAMVDEWGRQSFPASDPPSNW